MQPYKKFPAITPAKVSLKKTGFFLSTALPFLGDFAVAFCELKI
jgi:hypothetical protein